MSNNDPLGRMSRDFALGQQLHHDMGALQGLVQESSLRMDRIESRFASVDDRLSQLVAIAGRMDLRHVFVAAVCGTFAGCLAGAMAAALTMHFALAHGIVG